MSENDKNQSSKQDSICFIYCPNCKEVTNGVSFNLLKKTENAYVNCIKCGGVTIVRLDGKNVFIERG